METVADSNDMEEPNVLSTRSNTILAISGLMVYTTPFVMFLMRTDPLRGQMGGGWTLEIETLTKFVAIFSIYITCSLFNIYIMTAYVINIFT
jgi:hypothetical protein